MDIHVHAFVPSIYTCAARSAVMVARRRFSAAAASCDASVGAATSLFNTTK